MKEAAQGEPIQHEVFEKPFQVKPVFEVWETPENYRRFPSGADLPPTVKVWRIRTAEAEKGNPSEPLGVVSNCWGYDDSPDAEILTAGYNVGKENGGVGVGRHGNFLQWGFGALPSTMTDAGQKFFLNCICYIAKFDGKAPLIHRESGNRFEPVRLAMAMSYISDKKFFQSTFAPDLMEKYGSDWQGLMKFYQENYEWIYCDKTYQIDDDLKSLGIPSNRKPETLERLIALLADPQKGELARKLLGRYTVESFQTPEEWQAWLEKNRSRIYFSDVGGYKFRIVPEGYLVK